MLPRFSPKSNNEDEKGEVGLKIHHARGSLTNSFELVQPSGFNSSGQPQKVRRQKKEGRSELK